VDTREIDRMGGLAKRLPLTANCFLLGAVAISGLPPLNGFVSELFIYLGLLRTLDSPGASLVQTAAFAVPALALTGALAVACFVKVYGMVFLGAPRSESADDAHESGTAMIVPMLVLAGCCTLIGVAPAAVAPLLDRVAADWAGEAIGDVSLAAAAPLAAISVIAAILVALFVAGTVLLLALGIRRAPTSVTWDCGYAAPSARMQYTSSSFAGTLVGLFSWALQPRTHRPRIEGLFPPESEFHSHVDDTVLHKAVWPVTGAVAKLFSRARYLQQGSLQAYLLYILVVIVFLLFWT
jgi:NADH:ubiquinone oxidoreductase subunit 5 (subunit L)/multisubunit Na+/H+ antiporter MnhA subunit